MRIADSAEFVTGALRSTDGVSQFDLRGVRSRARCGQLVTVVNISGEIDASTLESATAYVMRSISPGDALLVDMSDVSFFGVSGLSLLVAIEQTCSRTSSPWTLIAGSAVERVLRLSGHMDVLPIARSVDTAMQYFAYHAFMTAGS